MSEILPNLINLIEHLDGDKPAVKDARVLAHSALTAQSEDELRAVLTSVVAQWRETEDD